MSLKEKRLKIDSIDESIVDLISERAKIALEVGREKLDSGRDLHDDAREGDVLRRIRDLNDGPLTDEAIESIYQSIISACLELQKTQNLEG